MRPLVWLINSLPIRSRAYIKERILSAQALDYPRHRVYIHVDSWIEWLNRLTPCAKEPETVNWLEANLQPYDVVLDIGANIGAYSLIAAAFGGDSVKTYAVEPSPVTYSQLTRNIHLNQMSGRIFPFCIAFSDQNRVQFLQYSNPASGAAQHTWAGPSQVPSGKAYHAVMNCRLDDFLPLFHLDTPNLIKLDVDGYEHLVLTGAKQTLQSEKLRSVLVEIDHADQQHVKDVVHLLYNSGLHLNFEEKRRTVMNCIFSRTH